MIFGLEIDILTDYLDNIAVVIMELHSIAQNCAELHRLTIAHNCTQLIPIAHN
jgi:hypothetical protein